MRRATAGPAGEQNTAAAEIELLRRVAAGDLDAFEQLYLAYHRRLSRFLMRFSNNYATVEEIINDAMLVVWNKAGSFSGRSKVSTWIIGIAWRRGLKTFKRLDTAKRKERDFSESEQRRAGEDPSDRDRERDNWLASGLAQLSLEQRMTLELTYFMGNSCREIAEIMDCPVNTVKTRLFNARRRLRDLLPELAEPGSRSDGGQT